VHKTSEAALLIDFGRKGFAIRGKADEGRISYETGIARALSTFKDAQSTAEGRKGMLRSRGRRYQQGNQ